MAALSLAGVEKRSPEKWEKCHFFEKGHPKGRW